MKVIYYQQLHSNHYRNKEINQLLNALYNKLLKSRIMHKLVPCKIYKRDEKWYLQ